MSLLWAQSQCSVTKHREKLLALWWFDFNVLQLIRHLGCCSILAWLIRCQECVAVLVHWEKKGSRKLGHLFVCLFLHKLAYDKPGKNWAPIDICLLHYAEKANSDTTLLHYFLPVESCMRLQQLTFPVWQLDKETHRETSLCWSDLTASLYKRRH